MPMDRDEQRAATYWAEDAWGDEVPETWRQVPTAGVVPFLVRTLKGAGFNVPEPPQVIYDLSDDSEWAGMVDPETRVIHLHPKIRRAGVLVHELAHWVDLRDGHGPMFRSNHISLVDAAFGRGPAEWLAEFYAGVGLDLDPWRLPEGFPGSAFAGD